MMFLVLELNHRRLFIIYFSQIQDGDIQNGDVQDGDVQDGVPFLYFIQAPLYFLIFIGPATIVEGNKDHFRSSQPPQINCRCGRRHTRVCEFATERLVH